MPASRSTDTRDRQRWTAEQDAALISAVAQVSSENPEINWHQVANHLPSRTNKDCRKRWHYQIACKIRKGPWTAEEDQRLRDAVQKHGTKWNKVSGDVGTRNGDQCWKRWNDNLDPAIDHSPWSGKEDTLLLEAVQMMGRNWSDIVGRHFPRRTALSAKNRFTLLNRPRASTRTRMNVGVDRRVSTPPSPSPSLSSSQSREDGNLDLLGMDTETIPIDTIPMNLGPSMSISNDLNGLGYDLDLTGYFANPAVQQATECASYPTPNSIVTPVDYAYSQVSNSPSHTFENEINYLGPLRDQVTEVIPRSRYFLADSSTKELAIWMRCRSDRTEAIMEGLTKLVNGLMAQGDVQDVNLSIV
ncbi:hypothetical protein F5X98DRAFT_331339 [Xylaria grammica]|nr:hypothetical protein F5X98DRAFT_331339 [Xylaria grammica]